MPTQVPARWWAPGPGEPTQRQAETSADKRHYVEQGMTPVACGRCATTVLVKKNSSKQTSVQWTTDSAASCPEIAAQVAAGTRSALVLSCPALQSSIQDAVAAGGLSVPGG